MQAVIDEFTALHNDKKFSEAHKLICDAIEKRSMHDPELFWRRAMVCRDLAMSKGKADKGAYKKYVNEGLQASEEGLKVDPDNAKCNSWYGVFLNYVSELEGIKKRIENSYKMKDHWLKAIASDPNDDTTLHALGRWCFEVTDLPWIQRKIAQAFFSTPPTSTYEEGLKYLLDSEKKSESAYAGNDLYLAKTYQRLGDKENAKRYCEKVLSNSGDDLETEQAKKEVASIIKSL
ncbi:unnamed protein product [Calicophoron daubneyi]|uniref:Regulator of microtubule dynamics protein 1 n=1 Tax=Calicophoron daubneyi TaxID=300641 RepID=A0AAV2TQ82_CALDB